MRCRSRYTFSIYIHHFRKLVQGHACLNLRPFWYLLLIQRSFSTVLDRRHILQAPVIHNTSLLKFLSESYYVDNSVLCLSSRCKAILIEKAADYELLAFPKINCLFENQQYILSFRVIIINDKMGISPASKHQNEYCIINSIHDINSITIVGKFCLLTISLWLCTDD